MGLDMHLEGRKYLWQNFEHPELERKEDNLPISQICVRLGYWRKHPNLHGYIVNTFAQGKDECQEIMLDADAIKQIITAIDESRLPFTEGFFFGVSENSVEQRQHDTTTFQRALTWLEAAPKQPQYEKVEIAGATMIKIDADMLATESRFVSYRASW